MKLFYFQGKNFGDQLNKWFWDKVLGPDIWDYGGSDTVLVGIGTLLGPRLPKFTHTLVMGSGLGYGSGLPKIDHSWEIYCVRGPLTAQKLGIKKNLAITDPAAFVARIWSPPKRIKRQQMVYMPHWTQSNHRVAKACVKAGFGYIDARAPVLRVMEAICRTDLLYTASLHGAIVADALGIPWQALRTEIGPYGVTPAFKWQDWCASVGLEYAPLTLSAKPNEPVELGYELQHLKEETKPLLSSRVLLDERLDRLEVVFRTFRNQWVRKTSRSPLDR